MTHKCGLSRRKLLLEWCPECNPEVENLVQQIVRLQSVTVSFPDSTLTRAERIAQGYCTRCARRMPPEGAKTCTVCRERERERERNIRVAHIELDTCSRCGGELEADDGKQCKKCKQRTREWNHKYNPNVGGKRGRPKKLPVEKETTATESGLL